MKWIDE